MFVLLIINCFELHKEITNRLYNNWVYLMNLKLDSSPFAIWKYETVDLFQLVYMVVFFLNQELSVRGFCYQLIILSTIFCSFM